MATKKTAGKTAKTVKAPKTYKTLAALLTAKSLGKLPRGVKVDVGEYNTHWLAGDHTVFTMKTVDFARASAAAKGFSLI